MWAEFEPSVSYLLELSSLFKPHFNPLTAALNFGK